MVVLQSVEADSEGTHAGINETFMHGLVVEPAIADHSPADATVTECAAYLWEVGTEERFTTGDDDSEWIGFAGVRYGVESAEEVVERHVFLSAAVFAVTATMAAMEIASRGTLPEEVVELVNACLVGSEEAE